MSAQAQEAIGELDVDAVFGLQHLVPPAVIAVRLRVLACKPNAQAGDALKNCGEGLERRRVSF